MCFSLFECLHVHADVESKTWTMLELKFRGETDQQFPVCYRYIFLKKDWLVSARGFRRRFQQVSFYSGQSSSQLWFKTLTDSKVVGDRTGCFSLSSHRQQEIEVNQCWPGRRSLLAKEGYRQWGDGAITLVISPLRDPRFTVSHITLIVVPPHRLFQVEPYSM